MKAAVLALALAAASAAAEPPRTALVIHGGAGVITRKDLPAAKQAEYEAALNQALDAGDAVLKRGGSAREAVIAAVRVMEDSPLFNAGKGAVFNAEGGHELDAAIMEGHTRRAGAVAGARTVKNPVLLAEAIMAHSPHVMLAGAGAEAFADTRPELERVEPTYFDTPHRLEQLRKAQDAVRMAVRPEKNTYFGTVGAVALDREGRIAAATSTGGMTNKRWGRIGDAPIIGAGTYADAQCGVSATGWGEFFIRATVAHDICARVAYRGDSLKAASDAVVMQVVPELGGDGGVIALDKDGNIALPFNTEGMYRGWIKPSGERGVAIFKE
ncbi:isoaspartyl peptidase/L-asparaginase [Arenimonas maotaiensis]|uniref:Isoaspartyl peptidase n=1 Tax=Arenimonas maotaiensis TaxID=1446479 RepID=A0A917FN38_9GAMM|nr:isoaspartyl peptidase/L-asparaginase [Arenimonas maotaiensis]GGF90604.1 isoaspartyl peptidase/L-asparaginase [Arenimonas maotaiensis]